MPSIQIIFMSIAAAVLYGIVHDQITARICIEYFTIGHPPIFGTDDPTLLGLGWGIIATWWVGLLIGIPLAIVSRAGTRPPRTCYSLLRPVATLLAVMGNLEAHMVCGQPMSMSAMRGHPMNGVNHQKPMMTQNSRHT